MANQPPWPWAKKHKLPLPYKPFCEFSIITGRTEYHYTKPHFHLDAYAKIITKCVGWYDNDIFLQKLKSGMSMI
jgi:hypothetical protein